MANKKMEVDILSDNTIKAVLDEDFEKLLKSLNVYDRIVAGEEKCCICGNTVTISSIAAIFPYQNKVHYCCDRQQCITKLKEMGNGINGKAN